MTYTTITASTHDAELRDRISAAVAKEAWANEDYAATEAGQLVQTNGPDPVVSQVVWPCCLDFEDAYAYAVDQGNEHPGGDPAVITDADIQSAVQVHWPTPPVPEEPVSWSWRYDSANPMLVILDNATDAEVQWGDGVSGGAEHTYAAPGLYDIIVTPAGGEQERVAVEVPNPNGGTP